MLLGKLEQKYKHTHIYVINDVSCMDTNISIDGSTKYVTLYLDLSISKREVIASMNKYFGLPSRVVLDWGSCFTSC